MYKDSLAHSLIRICRAHRNLLRYTLSKTGLHRGQPPVLFALHQKDGLTNSELADRLEVSPATVTNMVKRMECSGFVVRRRDDADERLSRVYLTETGVNILSELEVVLKGIDSKIFSGLDSDEQETLSRMLDKIHENINRALSQEVSGQNEITAYPHANGH